MIFRSTLFLAATLVVMALDTSSSFQPTYVPRVNRPFRLAAVHSAPEESREDRQLLEFHNLEPIPEPEARRKRIEQDQEIKAQFVPYGDELWDLRQQMNMLSMRLLDAINDGEDDAEELARQKLREAEKQDPELVYLLELLAVEDAERHGKTEQAQEHRQNALAARSVLPQFNLDGLWIGKFGTHGYEMINVTYTGDTLIATKVTGDKNVPRGQVSFQVNLHPLLSKSTSSRSSDQRLPPIQLSEAAAAKWGTRELPRYVGEGQVAEEGFINNQWMEGQLIIIGDDYFSFAWVPLETQIFFGRPSAEIALKMLRDQHQTFEEVPCMETSSLQTLQAFVHRCVEASHEVYEDRGGSDGCILWGEEECCFE